MKIIHIIPNLKKGGAERLSLDICNAFSKQDGLKVKLITFSAINEYPFLTENIDWEVIPSEIKLSFLRQNQCEVSQLQKVIEKFRPDIIHSHLFEAELVSRSIFYPNAKWFSHCHDNMQQFRNIRFGTFFSKKTLTNYFEKRYLFWNYKKNNGNHFIAISKDAETYYKRTAKPYPVTLLPNAIDYQRFFRPGTKNEPGKILRLINIGTFVKKKNQLFLLNVAIELKKQKIPFELHLVGDGFTRSNLEIQAENLGLGKAVIFHGIIDSVEKLLWDSDIYIHSATYEPLGLVLLEAMAAGLPVINLDGKGNRDLIVQGKNGYMLFEQDAEKFADKIIEVCGKKELLREMSAFAKQFAKGYDIKEYVVGLIEIYKEAF